MYKCTVLIQTDLAQYVFDYYAMYEYDLPASPMYLGYHPMNAVSKFAWNVAGQLTSHRSLDCTTDSSWKRPFYICKTSSPAFIR